MAATNDALPVFRPGDIFYKRQDKDHKKRGRPQNITVTVIEHDGTGYVYVDGRGMKHKEENMVRRDNKRPTEHNTIYCIQQQWVRIDYKTLWVYLLGIGPHTQSMQSVDVVGGLRYAKGILQSLQAIETSLSHPEAIRVKEDYIFNQIKVHGWTFEDFKTMLALYIKTIEQKGYPLLGVVEKYNEGGDLLPWHWAGVLLSTIRTHACLHKSSNDPHTNIQRQQQAVTRAACEWVNEIVGREICNNSIPPAIEYTGTQQALFEFYLIPIVPDHVRLMNAEYVTEVLKYRITDDNEQRERWKMLMQKYTFGPHLLCPHLTFSASVENIQSKKYIR
jgi:hypothetical protein